MGASITTLYRWTELLLIFAVLLQHLENLKIRFLPSIEKSNTRNHVLFGIEMAGTIATVLLGFLLLVGRVGPFTHVIMLALILLSLLSVAVRYGGSFNGGADQMSIQIALALFISSLVCLVFPAQTETAMKFGLLYIGIQLGLSYFMSGLTKIKNPQWWTGTALGEIIQSGNYEVPSFWKKFFAESSSRIFFASWMVLIFELAFPFMLAKPGLVSVALLIAFVFHLGNFALFGLNRFVFAWLAAYPSAYFVGRTLSNVLN